MLIDDLIVVDEVVVWGDVCDGLRGGWDGLRLWMLMRRRISIIAYVRLPYGGKGEKNKERIGRRPA